MAAIATSKQKSLETWIWDAACSIRGAQDAPKYKDFILPLIFDADYRPSTEVDIAAAREAVSLMNTIFNSF